MVHNIITPGSVIGIIGGGQLGRMMAVAASELGYKVHIFTPEQDSPASHVAYKTTVAEYTDKSALENFVNAVDVITFEFENIPHESLELLESRKQVCPSAHILKICRNRLREKTFINSLGIATTKFSKITSLAELEKAISAIGLPAVLKTTEMGYDGKGQVTLRAPEDASAAWESLQEAEAILEAFVNFEMEISVIVARAAANQSKCYIPVQNIHKNHILDKTIAPADVSESVMHQAETIAITIAEALDLKGVLAVEMFVTKDGKIVVNELAPRPHNSGHWTMDACVAGQFEQAIRAVCGLPLGNPARLCDAEMQNLIGDDVNNALQHLTNPNAKLHLYGKKESRPGRKMGHMNILKK
jgi:5-(carboxyamino)imidazole ribonucleotide synthase